MQPSPRIALSGILSRCAFGEGRAELRIAPFAFSWEAAPVWSLVFTQPSFDATALGNCLNEELEVEICDQYAMLYDVLNHEEHMLGGAELTVDQVAYDVADLTTHVRTLQEHNTYLSNLLQAATQKDVEGRAILRELFRRAEIKAAASDHLRERQAAAIEVLKRLRTHFGD